MVKLNNQNEWNTLRRYQRKCFNQYQPGCVYFMAEKSKCDLDGSNDAMILPAN